MSAKEFTIVRDLEGSPERVWQAWIDPAQMTAWMHPRGFHTPLEQIAVDARVGGSYAYTMVDDETGQAYPSAGEFLELDEPHRISMSWGSPGDAVADAPRITVELEPREGGRTRLTFTLQGIAGQPGDDDVYDGWDEALANLRSALQS